MTYAPTGYDLRTLSLDWGGSVVGGPVLCALGAFGASGLAVETEPFYFWLLGNMDGQKLTITDPTYTAQTRKWTKAEAVSADGLVVAGYGGTKVGNRAFVTQVVDANTDPITLVSVALPNLDGGKFAEAYAMTPDGFYIVGRSDSPKGPQACLCFQDSVTLDWVAKPLRGPEDYARMRYSI